MRTALRPYRLSDSRLGGVVAAYHCSLVLKSDTGAADGPHVTPPKPLEHGHPSSS